MENIIGVAYIFLILIGVLLIFAAAIKAKKKEEALAKKVFLAALISIGIGMILLLISGPILS